MAAGTLIHLSAREFKVGDTIAPGNWGTILRSIGMGHHCWKRECSLEEIRHAEFPIKPCRYDAAFCFTNFASAAWWWRHERHSDRWYAVQVVDTSLPIHVGDFLGVQMIEGVDASPEAAARRYWSNGKPRFTAPDGTLINELVTASALLVVEIMAPPSE